jgi:sialic acid synthase SpsE/spore coat polysaccharide biosynthesis predicted glycosyltransferase SpsG
MAKFIAEISNNHNGDRKRCLKLIKSAARSGCWGVQFHLFRIEQLFAPQVLLASRKHRQRRRWELPIHFLKDMASCARDEGVKFGITPFDLDSLKHVENRADFLKISSYELPWTTLVRRCAETGLPLILSTAMADASECWNATEASLEAGCEDITLLHSINNYPVGRQDCNLAAIGTLRELLVREFEPTFSSSFFKAGWTDHSIDREVVSRAVHYWGSDVIEIGFDLDGRGEGAARNHCWLPEQTNDLINGMTPPAGSECDGLGRLISGPTEEKEHAWRADPADGLRPTQPVRSTWPMVQPGAMPKGPTVLFIPEGLGLGHVARSLALAEELRKNHDARIQFLIRATPGQRRLLQRNGFSWITLEGGVTPQKAVKEMAFHPRFKQAICVLDMADNAIDLVGDLQSAGHPVVVLDQADCLSADLVVMPSFGWQKKDHEGPMARNIIGGTDFLLVRQDVTLLHPVKSPAYCEPRIVVSFGGADPNRLTEKVAKALYAVPDDVIVQFVIGPGFEDFLVRSAHLFMDHPTFEIIDTGDPLESILPGAGLLVTAMGVTIAEANTLGVPVAVLANSEEDAATVSRLESAGVVTSLGHGPSATSAVLAEQLAVLWRDTECRVRNAERGWNLVHGQGAPTVAKLLCDLADK